MSIKGRGIIRDIIRINPLLYGLQEKIDREQDCVIEDMTSPAEKVVQKLIELDNRRIDLCNLKVLYAFIERGLGDKFELLRSCAFSGVDCDLYKLAVSQIELAGYTLERAENEFKYLFKLLNNKPRRKKLLRGAVINTQFSMQN